MPNPEAIIIASTAAGYVAGQVEEYRTQRKRDSLGDTVTEAGTVAIEAYEASDESQRVAPPKKSFLTRIAGNKALKPLALIGAGAAGLGAYAYTQQPETLYSQNTPKLEIVVDHSGATQLGLGGEPAVNHINELATRIYKS